MKLFSNKIKGDSSKSSWTDWVAKQKKIASSEKLTKEASKEEKKAESSKEKVVFASSNPKVKDGKHHYPINNAKQATDALIRMAEYKEVPKWFDGTLEELKASIYAAVKSTYPKVAQEKSEEAPEEEITEASTCDSCGEEEALEHKCASIPEPEETVEMEFSAEDEDDECYFCMDCAKMGCASHESIECKCEDEKCVCGCVDEEGSEKSVPGERMDEGTGEVVVISDPLYAGFKGKFTTVAKLTDKDKKWLQNYFGLYYPKEYAKALVQDY